MFEAPEAPKRKFTPAGSVYPTHAEIAAWMAASREFYFAEAARHVEMAEMCAGTLCTVDEHLADAREAMAQVDHFTPEAWKAAKA